MSSDEQLYERLLAGELGAFDGLYGRYERPLFAFIRSYLADRAQAEEVLHEAFMALLGEDRPRAMTVSVKAWLYAVSRNLCLNRLRSAGRAARAMDSLREQTPIACRAPDEALLDAETKEALRAAVARLPATLRELYAMRASGMSYEAVAQALEVPVGTVKSRVNSMFERLREELNS